MSRISLVVAMLVVSSCALARDYGSRCIRDKESADIPSAVTSRMKQQDMADFQLVDGMTCGDRRMWTAIRKADQRKVPRPPGYGYLIIYDLKSNSVEIDNNK